MLSRRLVRIKALQSVYAFRQRTETEKVDIAEQFRQSIKQLEKGYDLGLTLIKALDYFLLSEVDMEKEKYFPDKEQIRKNSLLSKNKLTPLFDSLEIKYAQDIWDNEGDALNLFLKELKERTFVQDYLVFEDPNYELSEQFIIKVLEFGFGKSKHITDVMDNYLLSWQDDKHVILRTLLNTIKGLKNQDVSLNRFIFSADAEVEVNFGTKLCEKAIELQDDILKEVKKHSNNWDVDRIAQTDQIIVLLAIIEFMHFDDIPLKVSMNEYLEIAKSHSTPQSSRFVNGVLDSYKNQLVKDGKIEKKGKGLQ